MKSDILEKVKEARAASILLAQIRSEVKNAALALASESILKNKNKIIESNKKDIENAKLLVEKGEITKSLLDRLKLDETKIEELSKMISSVARLEDPVGRVLYSIKIDEHLELFKITVPFGVIVSIFESRPDALPQIASLCIKSGNSVILKGGVEALESNRTIFEILDEAFVSVGLPSGCMQFVEDREAVKTLLKLDDMIDLIVPRGSNEFVRYIQENTRIPVLGHSSGICHIFIPHTTCAITINENADRNVIEDIHNQLNKIVPFLNDYRHSEGNSPAHIKSSIIGNSLTVFIENNKLKLGAWQGIFLCEFDGPRTRKIWIKVST